MRYSILIFHSDHKGLKGLKEARVPKGLREFRELPASKDLREP
jgi:hypothetical protein